MSKALLFSLTLNALLLLVFFVLINKLGGLRYVFFKAKNRGVAAVYMHRKNMFENLPADSTDVVFLGNSLTEKGEWHELFPGTDLKNRGISGDMTDGILDRMPVVLRLRPKKLFLLIGVNDLLFHRPAYILENYEKILEAITRLSPSTQVFVQSLLPVNNNLRSNGVFNKDITDVNLQLRALAEAKGLTFIDLHAAFADADGLLPEPYTQDGLHLNGEGYLRWREVLLPYVSEMNESREN